jgi:hypothetical protein
MRIIVSTPDHARHIGKRFSSMLSVPLTRGYFIAARVLGYKSWDELLEFCDWSPGYYTSQAAVPDSQCMPLALAMRRAYQTETLAHVAGVESLRAAEIVAIVRPSDGFAPPENPLGSAGRPPRLINPTIAPATHEHLSAQLHGVWQVAGRQDKIAKALRQIANLLEGLQLSEWPMNQFLYDLHQTPYGGWSPTYLADLRRAPKYVSEDELQSALLALDSVATTLARAEVLELAGYTEPLAKLVDQAKELLRAWRAKSVGHDGQPPQFDGTQPVEDEGLEVLRRHLRLTDTQEFVVSDPDCDADEARRLLEAIERLDESVRALKPIHWIVAKLRRGIARSDRRRGEANAERQPLTQPWDVWCVGAGAAVKLGTFAASSSMKAIATAPGSVTGRIIALPSGLRPPGLVTSARPQMPASAVLS